jgi:hypothetical protein
MRAENDAQLGHREPETFLWTELGADKWHVLVLALALCVLFWLYR